MARWLHFCHSPLATALEPKSEILFEIDDHFVRLLRHFKVYNFWEQEGTLGSLVVSRKSAAPSYDGAERSGIAANHCGMVKFERPSPQFRVIAEALQRYSKQASEIAQRGRGHTEVQQCKGKQRLLPNEGQMETDENSPSGLQVVHQMWVDGLIS